MTPGGVIVSARPPHIPAVALALHYAFERSVAAEASGIEPPDDLMAKGRVLLGAQHFANECVTCHGAPGLGQNPVAPSMRPRPQYLPAVVE